MLAWLLAGLNYCKSTTRLDECYVADVIAWRCDLLFIANHFKHGCHYD